jgi:hypothetical protein
MKALTKSRHDGEHTAAICTRAPPNTMQRCFPGRFRKTIQFREEAVALLDPLSRELKSVSNLNSATLR